MMQALAAYVMRGRMQAILMAAGLLLLALLLIPLSWPLSFFSGGVVGLVTLHRGAPAGLSVLAGGGLFLLLLGLLLPGNLYAVTGFALLAWLPVWLLALSLRRGVSLSLTLLLGFLFGVLLVGGFFLATGDPAAWWFSHFTQEVLPMLEKAGVVFEDKPRLEAELQRLSRLMTGSLAAVALLGSIAGLFVARNWQAALYNPGGFRAEFHALRFGVTAALLALALLAAGLVSDSDLLLNLLPLIVVLFLFQGLAIAHALIRRRGLGSAWLSGLYILLVFGLPYSPSLLALLGLADNWLDLRGRFGGPAGGNAVGT